MRQHVVARSGGRRPDRSPHQSRARSRPKNATSVGMPALDATSATFAAGSMPSTGMPALDEVPQQVAVVAGDLDHHRLRAPARGARSSSRRRRRSAPASSWSTTRSRRSREKMARRHSNPLDLHQQALRADAGVQRIDGSIAVRAARASGRRWRAAAAPRSTKRLAQRRAAGQAGGWRGAHVGAPREAQRVCRRVSARRSLAGACAAYHSTVQRSASASRRRGAQPSSARPARSRGAGARLRDGSLVALQRQPGRPPKLASAGRRACRPVQASLRAGPKLRPPARVALREQRARPAAGSPPAAPARAARDGSPPGGAARPAARARARARGRARAGPRPSRRRRSRCRRAPSRRRHRPEPSSCGGRRP